MVVQPQQNNNTLAIVLEAIGGLFGFFGIGWLVAGETTAGLILLIGGFVWVIAAIALTVATIGLFAICVVPINLAVMITSTVILINRLKERTMGMIR